MGRDLMLDRLARHAHTQPNAPALYARKEDESWQATTWADYHSQVRSFAAACAALGLRPGGGVGILAENSPSWVIAALGAMAARGVAIGIYQTSTPDQVAYILSHSEALLCVVEDQQQWEKIFQKRDQLPALRKVVLVRGPVPNDPLCTSFADFLRTGQGWEAEIEARLQAIQPGDLATLIYTSGTTGNPKGVMLSHHNLAWTASCGKDMVGGATADDCVVSYLPLSHIAEQMFTIYLPLTGGYRVYFAGSLERVKETLVVARPTFFLGVPRVWEKFKAALEARLREATGLQAAIVRWARQVGLRAGHERLNRGQPRGLLALQERMADRLFFSKLKRALGFDRLRLAVTGAAPIGREVLEFFLSLGIPIYEVYGQSEASGPTSFNLPFPGKARLGTVGRPIPGIEVKLAQDGEILVRGPNVFQGYYKDPEATAEVLQDGWLHSGDIGEFDEAGFLRITDRKKDLIKTSGGKYVAPQALEKLLKGIPIVSQAVVIGDNRKYLTALLTLEAERARAFARQRGLPEDLAQLAEHPEVLRFVQGEVDRINQGLARFETIKRFLLLANDFTTEGGELTPTQKVRRKVVAQKYASQIENMYAD
ncbi:MAG: long-chain fatty acid--CoA ligase [Myxococcales bacterium]|nr:long-chain fatty acid--CoA ligase [Myxococcota bacterium]MDW8282606.1 long-chain fatty acid--CoA ligase [Myxococcales bacterium]